MPTLYSTGCPKCQVLKKKLDAAGINYTIESDIEIMKDKGFLQVPILEVDGKYMNFTEANKWIGEQ